MGMNTVSFHNFKSQIFKLSVSNPKSKYVAYLSILSQISNCQGLGRKNKHEILKTIMVITITILLARDGHEYLWVEGGAPPHGRRPILPYV